MTTIQISISESMLNYNEMMGHISHRAHGAISTFVGTVRDFNQGKKVIGISYDVQVALCENVLQDIAIEVQKTIAKDLRIYIAHYMGRLEVGEASVLIGVSSVHRKEAITASSYIIEQLKVKAPIWKQEHYVDGSSDWVKGHALCQHA